MQEIKTKFGSLYYEETPVDGYAILSSDEKVISYVDNVQEFVHQVEINQDNWSDFIQFLAEYFDQPILYALKLQNLKDMVYAYNVEANKKNALTKRQSNKIVKDGYVIIGEHYMLFDFTEII